MVLKRSDCDPSRIGGGKDCVDSTNLSWEVSCSALNIHSTTPARAHSWTCQEHGKKGVSGKSSNIEKQTSEEQTVGKGRRG
jgi:hypothetical protein